MTVVENNYIAQISVELYLDESCDDDVDGYLIYLPTRSTGINQ